MKFGHYIPTMEAAGAAPMKSEDVIDINNQIQGTEISVDAPAGITEDTIDSNPQEIQSQQAANLRETIDDAAIEAAGDVTSSHGPIPIEKYYQAANQLDELQSAASEAVSDGQPLSRAAAVSIQTSMESLMKTLGLPAPVLVTTEAFSSKWAQQDATRITLEGIRSAVSSVATKILNALKAAASFVIGFLAKITANRALMKRHIQGLRVKLDSQRDFVTDAATVKGRFAHGLQIGNRSTPMTASLILANGSSACFLFDDAVKLVRQIRDGRSPVNIIEDFIQAASSNLGRPIDSMEIDGEQTDLFLALPNANSIAFPGEGDRKRMIYATNQNGEPAEKEMPAMSAVQIAALLDRAEGTLDDLVTVEKHSNTLTDAIRGIIRMVEKQFSQLTNGNDPDKRRANDIARDTQDVLNKMVARLPRSVFTGIQFSVEYAEACIRNLTKP